MTSTYIITLIITDVNIDLFNFYKYVLHYFYSSVS